MKRLSPRTTVNLLPLLCSLSLLAASSGCSPSPGEEGEAVQIIIDQDMADGGARDMRMEEDGAMIVARDMDDKGQPDQGFMGEDAPEDLSDMIVDATMEVDAQMIEEMGPQEEMGQDLGVPEEDMAPEDMGPPAVAYVELTETSVQQLFPGRQPGSLPSSRTMRIFYSQDLGVHVGLDERSGWGVAEVEQVFESLARFRRELPETYLPLFELSNQGSTQWLRRPQQAPWTNANLTRAFVILSDDFQSAGATMATNFYALGPGNAQSVYENVPFLNVRPEVIEGAFQGVGPGPIYPGLTAAQARDEYLKEGLADSLLHERLHAFISQFYAHDALFSELRNGTSCGYALEELLVRRHLTYYYMQHPNLFSSAHTSYWAQDLNLLSSQVEQSSCYVSFMNRGWLTQPLLHLPHMP